MSRKNLSRMAAARKMATHNVELHQEKRENLTRRMKEQTGRDLPPFLLCRRVGTLAADKVMPWWKIDQCRGCGTNVYFDPMYAPASVPHVCMVCASGESKSLRIDGLDDTPVTKDDLGDQARYARVLRSISQHENREHPGQMKRT